MQSPPPPRRLQHPSTGGDPQNSTSGGCSPAAGRGLCGGCGCSRRGSGTVCIANGAVRRLLPFRGGGAGGAAPLRELRETRARAALPGAAPRVRAAPLHLARGGAGRGACVMGCGWRWYRELRRRCRWGESLAGMNLAGGEVPPFWPPWMGYRGRWPCWQGGGGSSATPYPARSAALQHYPAQPHTSQLLKPTPQTTSDAPTPARGGGAERSPHAPGSLPVSSLCPLWGSSWQDGTYTYTEGAHFYGGLFRSAFRSRPAEAPCPGTRCGCASVSPSAHRGVLGTAFPVFLRSIPGKLWVSLSRLFLAW